MHAGQLVVPAETVRALIRDQFPQWSELAVTPLKGQGTVNAIYRIGEAYTARFPLEPGDPAEVRRVLRREADAAAELAGHTRFATPRPVALGEPGHGYPLPWSVQTWLSGEIATPTGAADSVGLALDLAEFIRAARALDTRGRTFRGDGRGGEIAAHEEWMRTCFARSEGLLDVARLRGIWADLRVLPRGPSPDVMSHGDLIPGNVLVERGRLAGLLDVGGFGPADPALDLVCAWHLLDAGPRRALREALGCGEAEWLRGKAWAFQQAMGLVWYYRTSNPPMSSLGRITLGRLITDADGAGDADRAGDGASPAD